MVAQYSMSANNSMPEKILSKWQLLGSFLEQVQASIIVVNSSGKVVAVNKMTEDMFGYKEEELLGKPIERLIPSRYHGQHTEFRTDYLADPVARPMGSHRDLFGRRHDGSEFLMTINLSAVQTEQGLFVMSYITEATKSTHDTEELEKLSQAIQQTSDHVVITDKEGIIEYVNPSFEAATGFTKEEVIGKTPRILKSGQHQPNFYKDFWDVILAGKTYRGVFINKRKNGTIYCDEKTVTPIKDQQGSITYFVSTGRDITKKIEVEKALKESERQLRNFRDTVQEGIYRTTPEGTILYGNRALAEMFGYDSVMELLAVNMGELYPAPENRNEFIRQINREERIKGMESCRRKRDGQEFWVQETAHVVKDEHGAVLYYEGFITDITARKQLEAERLRTQKLESLGLLTAGLAHDFNNFLTSILFNVSSARTVAVGDEKIQELLDGAEHAIQRAKTITRQLSTFTRDDKVVKDNVYLTPLLKESVIFSLHGTRVAPVFHLEERLYPVHIDSGQINQVISNLVINAVQAMPNGGTLTISTSNEIYTRDSHRTPLNPSDYVRVELHDNGNGIPAKNIGKIFDPYFTSKKDGSGLGLFSCFNIIDQHGGWITVESVEGEGSKFTFYLPAVGISQTDETVHTKPVSKPIRILLVENDTEIRENLSKLLTVLGHRVDMAVDGRSAIHHFRECQLVENPCQLVILDVGLPGRYDGPKIFSKLKRSNPDIKGILMTTHDVETNAIKDSQGDFIGYLRKPIGPSELRQVLRKALV